MRIASRIVPLAMPKRSISLGSEGRRSPALSPRATTHSLICSATRTGRLPLYAAAFSGIERVVAGGKLILSHLFEWRVLFAAQRCCARATTGKSAARRRVERIGKLGVLLFRRLQRTADLGRTFRQKSCIGMT